MLLEGSRGFTSTASTAMQVSLSSGWGCFHAPSLGSPGWCSFSKAQLADLQAVPAGRVLLETDAPYFQFPGHRHSFPGLIEMCAGSPFWRGPLLSGCQDWRENDVCTFVTYHCRRRFVNDVTVGRSRYNKDNVQTKRSIR